MWWLGIASAAQVVDADGLRVDAGGDLKSFAAAVFPPEHIFYADPACEGYLTDTASCIAPSGQGITDLRLKLEARTDRFTFVVHHATTMTTPSGSSVSIGQAGVGRGAPELVDLSWSAVDEDDVSLSGRIDRLSMALRVPHLDVTLGRQPIGFGHAFFFSPLDVVNPFDPTIVDQEYRPGVDALRVDGYAGTAGLLTLAVAWTGTGLYEPGLEDVVLASYGQGTVGVWDLGGFAGLVRDEVVLGVSTVGSAGVVGLRSESTLTLVDEPFVRATVGADWMPNGRWMLSGEVYLQTVGASDPSEYLGQLVDERYARGELWLLGRTYLGMAATWEATPLVALSSVVIVNVEDGSCLVMPSLDWSVSEDVQLTASAFRGIGELDSSAIASEFGLYPTAFFLALKVYR